MASSLSLRETVGDVTECPICTETMVDPRVLPCIHTFCFKCLDQLWKDKSPGVKIPCPMCRTEVTIPVEGVSGCPKNFFVEKLVEAQKISETERTPVNCDICLGHNGIVSVSEKFCVECQQHMCEGCSKFHSSWKITSTHHVIPIGSKLTGAEELINFPKARCQSHKEEEIKIYCTECKIAVCTICFITKHNRHEGSDIQQVAEDLKEQIKTNIKDARKILGEVKTQSERLEKVSQNFHLKIKETETKIVETGEKMKRRINELVQALLQELDDERTKRVKELDVCQEELLVQKLSLDSFIKYSEKILEKAVPADVASVSKDLAFRFESLKNSNIARLGESLEVAFIPNDSHQWVHGNDKSFIGKIRFCGSVIESKTRTSVSYDDDPKLHNSVQFSSYVNGIATLGEQLYVVIQGSNEVKVFNSSTLTHQSSIPVAGLSSPVDLVANENLLFVGGSDTIYRVELRDKSVKTWSVGSVFTSLSINKLGNVIVVSTGAKKLYEYTPVGGLLREIVLSDDFITPYRAIQVENDQFLICQGDGTLHRVCLIDNRGNLIKSFGSTSGSGNAKLSSPYRLVVDRNGFILVADHGNNRVVLLNKQLEYLKDSILPSSTKLNGIYTLFLDQNNGRLYLSDYFNKKLVKFDFETRICTGTLMLSQSDNLFIWCLQEI